MSLLRDWLYFYDLDWSRGEDRREAKCSSGGFRLFVRSWCSLGEGLQQEEQSSPKPELCEATEAFCTITFCF